MRKINELQYINSDGINEDKLYFISSGTNVLYTLSIKDLVIEKVAVLEKKSSLWAVIVDGNIVYCCALDDCSIYIFNINDSRINTFVCQNRTKCMIDAFMYNERIVFIPGDMSENLCIFDIKKHIYSSEVFDLKKNIGVAMMGDAYVWNRYKNVFCYVANTRDNMIICDISNGKCFQQKSPIKGAIKDCIYIDNKIYILFEGKNSLYVYDIKTAELNVFNSDEKSQHRKLIAYKFGVFIVCRDRVLNFDGKEIYPIGIENKCSNNGAAFVKVIDVNDKVFFLPWAESVFAVFDIVSKETEIHKMQLPIHDVMHIKPIIVEDECLLSDYLFEISR